MSVNGCLSSSMMSSKHLSGIPNCLFGECIDGPSGVYCDCWDGYQHDKIVGRYNNCGMPEVMPFIGEGIAIAVNFAASVFGLYIVQYGCEHKTDAQRVAISSTVTSLSLLIGNIILLSNKSIMPWYGAIFIDIGMSALCLTYGLVIYTALKPISIFMNIKHIDGIKKTLTMIIPTIVFTASITCTIVGHILGDDRSIAMAIAICYIFIAFCSMCYLPTIKVLNDLLKALDDASASKQTKPPGLHSVPVQKSSWPGLTLAPRNSAASSLDIHRLHNNDVAGDPLIQQPKPRLRLSQRLMTLADKFKSSLGNNSSLNREPSHSHVEVEHSQSHLHDAQLDTEAAIKQKEAYLSKQEKIQYFRKKVSVMRLTSSLACATLTIFSLAAALFDLISGTLPLSGFLFFGLSIFVGIYSIQVSHYAWNHKMGGKKRKNREVVNQVDSNSRKTNESEQEKTKRNSSNHAGPNATTTVRTSNPFPNVGSPENRISNMSSKPHPSDLHESERIPENQIMVDAPAIPNELIGNNVEDMVPVETEEANR